MTEKTTPSFCRVCRRVIDAEAVACPVCGRQYHSACLKIHQCRPVPVASAKQTVNPPQVQNQQIQQTNVSAPVKKSTATGESELATEPASQLLPVRSLRSKQAAYTPDWLWGLGLIVIILSLCLLGAFYWVFNNPAAKSQKALQAGIIALQSGDATRAQIQLNKALEIREKNAEAHLCMGFLALGIFDDDRIVDRMEILSHNAAWGDTTTLNLADWHFNRCLEISVNNPRGKMLGQSFASSVEEMQVMAWIGQSLTAMLRVIAAIEADKQREARAWLDVTKTDLNSADAIIPTKISSDLKNTAADIESLLVN